MRQIMNVGDLKNIIRDYPDDTRVLIVTEGDKWWIRGRTIKSAVEGIVMLPMDTDKIDVYPSQETMMEECRTTFAKFGGDDEPLPEYETEKVVLLGAEEKFGDKWEDMT